jgi:uncharacterized repeat protein (TIGR01451 family)
MAGSLRRGVLIAALVAAGAAPRLHAQSADLGVVKNGPDQATAGSDVAYDILVLNNGPDPASSAMLTDTIPAGMTFVSRMQNSGPSFTCTDPGAGFGGSVSCTLATFPAGSSATFTFVFHIPNGTPDGTLFQNTATIMSATPDDSTENNSSVAGTSTPPAPQPDVGVSKTGPPPAAPGTNVTFTITVSNFSASPASSVVLQDPLPGTMTFVSLNPNAGCTMPMPGNGGTINCSIGTMAGGSSITYTLVGKIPAGTASGTTFTNVATISSANDPNSENNSSSAAVTVSSVDLSVTKAGPAAVVAGNPLTYTITVANAGPDVATNVNLTDTMPSGTTFNSMIQNTGPTASCSLPPVGGNGTIACSFALFASGASAQFTLTLTPGNVTSVSNTANVSSDSFDTNAANNSSTASTTVTPSADLALTKTAPGVVTVGTNLSYSLTATNNGPSDATAVSLTDVTPANTTFVSFTAPAGWTVTAPAVGGSGTVMATTPTLIAASSAMFTLVVQVSSGAPVGSTITNTATISSGTPDPNAANNSATATTTVAAAISDLSITKTTAPSVLVNSNATFAIAVTNAGPNSATGVTIVDVLPASVTFVSATPSQGTCSGTTTVTCSLGIMASGATATVTIVTHASTFGPATNTATVSSTSSDPNPANNTSTATFFVVAQIPTLSPLLLALLAALLAAIALRLLTE